MSHEDFRRMMPEGDRRGLTHLMTLTWENRCREKQPYHSVKIQVNPVASKQITKEVVDTAIEQLKMELSGKS